MNYSLHPKERIEVAVNLDVLADMAFWVDREAWNAMSEEARDTLIEEKITALYVAWQDINANGAPHDGTPAICIGSIERDKQVETTIYDPEEG